MGDCFIESHLNLNHLDDLGVNGHAIWEVFGACEIKLGGTTISVDHDKILANDIP
jgi:hypothetical protein